MRQSNSGRGQATTFFLPGYLDSARIWIAAGQLKFFTLVAGGRTQLVEPSFVNPHDPSAAVKYGFVELTLDNNGLWANLSFVDFVGFVLGMSLTTSDGRTQAVAGLTRDAVGQIHREMKAQSAADGVAEWGLMCQTGRGGLVDRLKPLKSLLERDRLGRGTTGGGVRERRSKDR